MKKYLIVGLESSVTKALSRIVARNLEIKGHQKYDGNYSISDNNFLVQHYSLPYGRKPNRNYPSIIESEWDFILICNRDFYCSLNSKIKKHTRGNKEVAIQQHKKGSDILREVAQFENVYFFSYESWFILKDIYLQKFLKSVNINYNHPAIAKDINLKYIK